MPKRDLIYSMGLSKLNVAQSDIVNFFERKKQGVFKRAEIDRIIHQKRKDWNLAQSMTAKEFIEFLKGICVLKEHRMNFPHRQEVRYVWGMTSEYQLIQSLRPNSYFSHSTALSLHGLNTQSLKTIYLNYEQPRKRNPDRQLTQDRIQWAFERACRKSNNTARLHGKRICLLNGQFTGQLGVISIPDSSGANVLVSNIERTLIDCTVRPVYAGGVRVVIEAFQAASKRISVDELTKMFSALNFIYPYHQAIGFYMECSGVYTSEQIAAFDTFEKRFDFYLTYKMKRPKFSKHWRLYYPSGI
jgi:hypothetical protein